MDNFPEARALADRIEAVTYHLELGLEIADDLIDWTPQKVVSAKALRNRPIPVKMPRFDELSYLSTWRGIFWGMYGPAGRAKEYARNERLAKAWKAHESYWAVKSLEVV